MSNESKLTSVVSVRVDESTHKVIAGLQLNRGFTEREANEIVRAALVVGLGVIATRPKDHAMTLAKAVNEK